MERALRSMSVAVLVRHAAECRTWWNYEGVVSPYARFYSLLDGEAEIEHHGRRFRLVPGRIYLIPASTRLNMHCKTRMLQRWVHFRAELPNGFDIFQIFTPAYELELSACPSWAPAMLDRLWEIPEEGGDLDMLEAESILRLFITLLLRNGPEAQDSDAKLASMIKFKAAFEHIEANLERKIALEDLARKVFLHPAYFSNEFRRRMGLPPMEYVRARRIERARNLLLDPDNKLSEIAARTGFTDAFHFSRTFKRIAGLSPSEFRRRAQSVLS